MDNDCWYDDLCAAVASSLNSIGLTTSFASTAVISSLDSLPSSMSAMDNVRLEVKGLKSALKDDEVRRKFARQLGLNDVR